MDGRDSRILYNDDAEPTHGRAPAGEPALSEWHDACKIPGMTTRHMICAPAPAEDESYSEQARRRAARWHAWLKSPHCTLQDRENFERWCADPTNATAYVAFCGDLAAVPELATEPEDVSEFDYGTHSFALPVNSPRLEADPR
jgi:hypothetical protein